MPPTITYTSWDLLGMPYQSTSELPSSRSPESYLVCSTVHFEVTFVKVSRVRGLPVLSGVPVKQRLVFDGVENVILRRTPKLERTTETQGATYVTCVGKEHVWITANNRLTRMTSKGSSDVLDRGRT